MRKRIFIIFLSFLLLFVGNPVYSSEISQKYLEKYVNKISNKFSRTYCNTKNFGISDDGALAFAIGETSKEFKNNQLNNHIDYSLLKETIISSLESNCQVYDLSLDNLKNFKIK